MGFSEVRNLASGQGSSSKASAVDAIWLVLYIRLSSVVLVYKGAVVLCWPV